MSQLVEVASTIGMRLRDKRKSAGLTHAALAEAIGKTENYISKIECGKAAPSLRSLTGIAALLGVDLFYFFEPCAAPPGDARDTKEEALVAMYRRLRPDQQDAFYQFIAANLPLFSRMTFS